MLRLAWSLFFLAPGVGEWLLGNQPASDFAAILVLAPMYGGGALLIREVARRSGRGWPTIAVLATAYAVIEEGPIDQMIYNPGYLGLSSFDGLLEVPGTGVSLSLLLASIALHTVWSICTPIALVEAFDRSNRPWLRTRGLVIVAVVFVAGSVLLTWAQADENHFFASPGQLAVTWAVILGLVVVAFRLPRPAAGSGRAPSPLITGIVAFAVTSLYWVESLLTAYVIAVSPWFDVLTFATLTLFGVWLVANWSRREDWGQVHVVALGSGAALTYAWVGFFNSAHLDVTTAEAMIGSSAFAAAAIALVGWAVRRVRLVPTGL
ncbi:MAG TPA: hypothetical protein VHD81_12445 [Mycobacteriales bacterium]|nr:hypothetical protein [Mycobacteriales bacterium]